jgi:hypothetical protein
VGQIIVKLEPDPDFFGISASHILQHVVVSLLSLPQHGDLKIEPGDLFDRGGQEIESLLFRKP